MNKLIVLAVLAGGGYAGYRHFHHSETVQVYESFTQSLLRGRYDQARDLTAGEARSRFADLQKDVDRYRGTAQFISASYQVVSETQGDGGNRSTIQATQIARWDPPGQTSAMGSVRVYHDHRMELERRDGAWRVVRFEDRVTRTLDWKGNPL